MSLSRPLRFDPLLLIVAAAMAGGLACVAPRETLAAAGASLAVASRRLRRREWVLAALTFLVAWGRAAATIADYRNQRDAAIQWLDGPKRCSFHARVKRSPTFGAGRIRWVAEATQLDCEGRTHPGPLPVRLSGAPDDLRRGDTVRVVSGLAPVRLLRNLDLADPTPGASRRGAVLSGSAISVEILTHSQSLVAQIDRFRAHVRRRIRASFAPNTEAMARALVLGESDLNQQDTQAFQKSGLAHLLAVSGAHLVLAVLALVKGFEKLLLRLPLVAARWDLRRPSAALGLVLAPLYSDFAGGSGSAWRAAFMLMVAFAAQSCGRRAPVGRALLLSGLIGWLADPLTAFDISFLLSLAASAGLVLAGRAPSPPGARGALHWVVLGTRTTAAATAPCVPLLLLLAPELTLASVAGNLLAAPLGELVCLPLCLLHALLSPLPALEQGVAVAASGGLRVVGALAHAAAAAPGLAGELPPPSAAQLSVLGVGGLGALALAAAPWQPTPARGRTNLPAAGGWLLLAAGLLVWCEWAQRCHGSPGLCSQAPAELRVTLLDVGQGDSVLVDLPDGRLVLIDGGGWVGSPSNPGTRVILPTLRARRRRHLDIVVLSHPHPDHYGGLRAVTDRISVGEVWDTGAAATGSPGHPTKGEYAAWLASLRERAIPILGPRELCARADNATRPLRVLAPCPGPAPELGANDNSFVVAAAWAGHQALLVGDAEREAERRLISSSGEQLRSSLLKVGHHGSRTSTTAELLAVAKPCLAVLSVGARNRFGHPHRATLKRLAKAGAAALRTDELGACQWRAQAGAQYLRCFVPGTVRCQPASSQPLGQLLHQ